MTRLSVAECQSIFGVTGGPEFTANKVRDWLKQVEVQTLFIKPGSPWENGSIENFNGKLRDELLSRDLFDTMLEAKLLIERWRNHYNTARLSAPGTRSDSAPFARFGYAPASERGWPSGHP